VSRGSIEAKRTSRQANPSRQRARVPAVARKDNAVPDSLDYRGYEVYRGLWYSLTHHQWRYQLREQKLRDNYCQIGNENLLVSEYKILRNFL
jgi:hypothetical protein